VWNLSEVSALGGCQLPGGSTYSDLGSLVCWRQVFTSPVFKVIRSAFRCKLLFHYLQWPKKRSYPGTSSHDPTAKLLQSSQILLIEQK
jgi:hypothetical protein